MTQPFTVCPGRKEEAPLFPLWHTECLDCLRRMAIIKPKDVVISPWAGHGPCPDKLEMKNENA
jgi:hypothetical protein